MSISAAVTLNPTAVVVEQKCQALVTISNSGSSEVFISNLVPHCFPSTPPATHGSTFAAIGPANVPPNSPVPAGGTLLVNFPIIFHAGSGLGTFSVGCYVYGADGELVNATAGTITVTGNVQTA